MTFEPAAAELGQRPPRASGRLWILVVEDDPDIAQLVCFNLDQQGLPAASVTDGEQALVVVEKDPPALMVLDLMLPGMTGLEVCKRIRGDAATAALPIVMLTARAAEADRMRGLRAGADDYVTKPFSPRELVSRVRAVLHRAAEQSTAHATSIEHRRKDHSDDPDLRP
jgi:two-component system phosphate regulon response regulator PhoB